jgi:hypothetical protein
VKGLEKQGFFGRNRGRRRYNGGMARGLSAGAISPRDLFAVCSLKSEYARAGSEMTR